MSQGKPVEHIQIPQKPKQMNVDTSVFLHQGKVVMQFNIEIRNLIMSPAEAVAYAKAFLQGAQRQDPKSVEGFTWPS